MAEAIAILSLVCNLMQVISFSAEVIRLCRNASKDGSPDPNLSTNVAQFSALLSTLQETTSNFDPTFSSDCKSPQEQLRTQEARNRLEALASALIKDTRNLQRLQQKITTATPSRRRTRVWVVLEYKLRYRSQIASLEDRIAKTRDVLDTEFLSRICSSTQANRARSEEMFAKLHDDIQHFIVRWSEGKRDLSQLVAIEAQETRSHVTAEVKPIKDQVEVINSRMVSDTALRQSEEARARFLSTLRFSEMNERENNIDDASEETMAWIFKYKPGQNVELTTSAEVTSERITKFGFVTWLQSDTGLFVTWLQSDTGLFWINGKPGSGKTTLMNYLARNRRTVENLRRWRPSVQILRFHFFELGSSNLQKQLRGCLCTLLHRIFNLIPDLLDGIIQLQPELAKKSSGHDWSVKELTSTLIGALQQSPSATCLFLDGLDEIIAGERTDIVNLVESLATLPNVKICVSSRPESLFQQRFAQYSSLRVQDLNSGAIKSYCKGALMVYKDRRHTSKSITELATTIAERSDGIFLWAALAVKSLIRGIENGDTTELLRKRTREFAPGLLPLYRQMWSKQNEDHPIYKEETANILDDIVKRGNLRSSQILVVMLLHAEATFGPELKNIIRTKGFWTSEDAVVLTKRLEVWLSTRTAGLLEVEKFSFGYSERAKIFAKRVVLIHRSAQEFLTGTTEGQEILKWRGKSTHDREIARMDAMIASSCCWASSRHPVFERVGHWQPKDDSDETEGVWSYFSWSGGLNSYTISAEQQLKSLQKQILAWSPPEEWQANYFKTLLYSAADSRDIPTLDYVGQLVWDDERFSVQEKRAFLKFCCGEFLKVLRIAVDDIGTMVWDFERSKVTLCWMSPGTLDLQS
ncbi:hypothetical protein F4780DRAFT_778842 [Xylariomycetidae sp. FL0641]|nr:hypothetical protein F4780DRAFT_778842 [Xylariomycetidae sp. FL0641]